MAVSQTKDYGFKPAPQAEPRQAPKNDPKKALNYTAASKAPEETRAATKTAFGDLPANDDAKQPGASPKLTMTSPQVVSDSGKAPSPVDPRVQSILDNRLADGKTVKEKIDADAPAYLAKAGQDHYNVQAEKGEPLDAISKFYLNISAQAIAKNGFKEDAITVENLDSVFNTELIQKNLDELSKDPDFAKWATEQQANSVQKTIEDNPGIARLLDPHKQEGENHVNALRRMQSDYITSQDFADGVARSDDGKTLTEDALKALSFLGLSEKEMLGVGNTLAENVRSKYAPDTPKTVIDPDTNKAVATEDGYNLATLPDGTHVALGTDGKAIADKQGNPYVYNADRSAKIDANNAYVQYHAKAHTTFASYGGTHYIVGPEGKGIVDTQGRPLAIDQGGGAPIALDKDGKAVTDKAGSNLVFDPMTGKAVVDPNSGNPVVIDPMTKGIVQTGGDGKLIAGKNGDPYAVDQKTGKFVQDAQGNHVQISKDAVAPGIVPGYVVDKNSTRIVVSPYTGKSIVDPATGKTVILAPKTNSPELVPLNANGAPKLVEDGRNIVYSPTGNTVVANEGKGPDWLVNADGRYVQNANGNYIGVDKQTGLAAPVDEKGFVRNSEGLAPLWDTKANAPMTTPAGDQVMIDRRGNLLKANVQGQTFVEEKSGLPFVLDPKSRESVVNPDTGRSIMLDKGGALIEYNADDGYKYLINPKTRTTVKTAEGNPVVMSDSAGVPYAITADGTAVKNPATGNTIVYGLDGQPGKEISTRNPLEITASGKAYVIDPKTNAPMAQKDPKTGGYQVYNKDGSALTNPDTGNKIQLAPSSALKVEIDVKTNKPVEDGKGNILLVGPDNRPLKTPEGHAVVAENKTGVPVAVDAQGKAITDPASGLPLVINTDTGKTVSDPKTGATVVADPKSGQPVQIDPKTKEPIKDPTTGLNIIANGKIGEQLQGPNGEPVVVAPGLAMPGYVDKATNTFTVFDFATGKAMGNPRTGAKTILDPDLGIPVEVLPDKAGNLYLVDGNGKVKTDPKGHALLLDKDTGQVVVKDAGGNTTDADTGKEPEKVDMKIVAHLLPLLPAASAAYQYSAKGNAKAGDLPAPPAEAPDGPSSVRTTPADREAIKAGWNSLENWGDFVPGHGFEAPYEFYEKWARDVQAADPRLLSVPVEDLAVLARYTAGADNINHALRSGGPNPIAPYYELSAKGIRSAINQMHELGYTYSGELFRNISQDASDISDNWQIGTRTKDPAFVSTTTDPEVAQGFGNLRLKFNTDIGVDISTVSVFPWQKEVLLPDGLEWDITKGGFYDGSDPLNRGRPVVYRDLDLVTSPNEQPQASTSGTTEPTTGSPSGSAGEAGTSASPRPSDVGSTTSQAADPLIPTSQAAANTSKWTKLGTAIGYAFDGLDIVGGGAQVVLGGLQIADGVKQKNPYDIASGALNTLSGGLGLSAGVAGLAGASAIAVPAALAAVIAGGIASIVDFVGSLDDDEHFADKLEKMYGPMGLLQEGWRKKAEEAYREATTRHINPDYQA